MSLAYPNGRPDVLNRSYPINVRFASITPAIIQIKRLINTSTAPKADFNPSSLFPRAVRAESKNISAKNTFTGKAINPRIAPTKKAGARKINGLSDDGYKTELKTTDFHLIAPSAKSVQLAADFTDWEKYPLHMIKAKNGVWFAIVPLAPGNYSYRFIVDGKWCDDPHSFRHTPNPFGTINSVVEVV